MEERLQERRGKINPNISLKGRMVPEQRFFRFLQCCTKFHKKKKKNLKITETPKMIGKVETGTINRERRKKKNNDSHSHNGSNNQHNSHKPSTKKKH